MKPKRIQLSRNAGWRMPPNTVKVSRPSKWENPFKIGKDCDTAEGSVKMYKDAIECGLSIVPSLKEIMELRGKNLACWCANSPCHADILLEIANK